MNRMDNFYCVRQRVHTLSVQFKFIDKNMFSIQMKKINGNP